MGSRHRAHIAPWSAARRAASAQTPPVLGTPPKAMLGDWEFSNAARDKICTASFKRDPARSASSSSSTSIAPACSRWSRKSSAGVFPTATTCFCSMPTANRWRNSARSKAACSKRRRRVLACCFCKPRPPPPGRQQKTPQELAGYWTVTRGGADDLHSVACRVDARPMAFALTVNSGCDPSMAA